MKKQLLKIICLLSALLALILVAFCYFQGKRLASPERRELQEYHYDWLNHPASHGISIRKVNMLDGDVPCLIVSPNSEGKLGKRGEILRQQMKDRGHELGASGCVVGNIVLLHGRNGRKEDLLPVAERFCAVGLRCIIPDLPAHGESPIETVKFGSGNEEGSIPQKVLDECCSFYKGENLPCALWGMSMGGSFATRAAYAGGKWKGLVIVSSFDSLEGVLLDTAKWKPLVSLTGYFCRKHGGADIAAVQPAEWASSVDIPVLVVHGTADSLISSESGKRLYQSFASKHKKWLDVPDGDHHNVLVTPMPLYVEMAEWLLSSVKG